VKYTVSTKLAQFFTDKVDGVRQKILHHHHTVCAVDRSFEDVTEEIQKCMLDSPIKTRAFNPLPTNVPREVPRYCFNNV